ncbi:hypothetical protein [Bradymonas sediminis]|nr:hypothetical protein [Bradymonas sediminis]
MNRKRIISTCLSVGMALSLGACGDTGDGDVGPGVETAGMALNIDLIGGSDVAGFRFTATPVDCDTGLPTGDPAMSAEESLEQVNLPGDNSTFEKKPYDPDSSHHFSDHFFTVAPGCYDIEATPITGDGDDSLDCATATLYNETVYDDTFNEFLLISQCRGVARTALDVIGTLNHPPEISLEIDKFMCAGAGVVACATASDPDGDPLEFTWEGREGECFEPEVISNTTDPETGEVTECVVIPSRRAKSLGYKVTVRDLAWENWCLTPIEDILPEQTGVDFDASESQASIKFKTHALADCTPAGMAFIGVTLGADLCVVDGKLKTDDSMGMKKSQATKLAKNAVDYVNPNLLGDPDPRILVVRDTVNNEDPYEDEYIKARLEAAGFTQVDLIDEPVGGLKRYQTISYSVIWFVNPGYPINNKKTYRTLTKFRELGGGVIISGDDANQNQDLQPPNWYNMETFSFMGFDDTATNDNPNGTYTCGYLTDQNQGKRYIVKFDAASPLASGMGDLTFPYGNDIDRNYALGLGETVGATTVGLYYPGKKECLVDPVTVMTTVPAGTVLPSP